MAEHPDSEFDGNFCTLYRSYGTFVRRVLVRLNVPQANVDDVAQEVFITVLKKLPEFEQRSHVKTWIFGICKKKASEDRCRAYNRYEQPVAEPVGPGATVEPAQGVQRCGESELLDKALGHLSEVQRQVFVRRVLEGQSVAEIANALNCSPFTVYTRLGVAARKVQTFVGKRCGPSALLLWAGRGRERAQAAALGPRVWFRWSLNFVLPLTAAICVVMTPLPGDSPRTDAPAAARTTADSAPRVELTQPPMAEPSAAPAAPVVLAAKQIEPQPRKRKRAPRPKPARRAELDVTRAAIDDPPLPPPQPEREQDLLWRSRFALDTDPGKALALAQEHAASHPTGLLQQDREVLAIEALLRLRRKSAALERAEGFAAAHPDSPYAQPVRQLIERLSFEPRRLTVADSR